MGSPSISSRLVQLPSESSISSLSMVMLRCARSTGASMTLMVSVPVFVNPGNLSAGILNPATANAPIISTAKSVPTAAKYPALWMGSAIVFFLSSIVPYPFRRRVI